MSTRFVHTESERMWKEITRVLHVPNNRVRRAGTHSTIKMANQIHVHCAPIGWPPVTEARNGSPCQRDEHEKAKKKKTFSTHRRHIGRPIDKVPNILLFRSFEQIRFVIFLVRVCSCVCARRFSRHVVRFNLLDGIVFGQMEGGSSQWRMETTST